MILSQIVCYTFLLGANKNTQDLLIFVIFKIYISILFVEVLYVIESSTVTKQTLALDAENWKTGPTLFAVLSFKKNGKISFRSFKKV